MIRPARLRLALRFGSARQSDGDDAEKTTTFPFEDFQARWPPRRSWTDQP